MQVTHARTTSMPLMPAWTQAMPTDPKHKKPMPERSARRNQA